MVLVTEGLGAQPFHGRTVVLINEHSHSAAEMVASFAKENHLATLVGTEQQVRSSVVRISSCPVDMCSACPSPAGTTWNGECIEGKGVEADVPIENSPESLAAGVDNQLQAALRVVNTLRKRPLTRNNVTAGVSRKDYEDCAGRHRGFRRFG